MINNIHRPSGIGEWLLFVVSLYTGGQGLLNVVNHMTDRVYLEQPVSTSNNIINIGIYSFFFIGSVVQFWDIHRIFIISTFLITLSAIMSVVLTRNESSNLIFLPFEFLGALGWILLAVSVLIRPSGVLPKKLILSHGTHEVRLLDIGKHKFLVTNNISQITGRKSGEILAALNDLPLVITDNISAETAEEIRERIESIGGRVNVRDTAI